MGDIKEGFRRFSVFVGAIGVALWLSFMSWLLIWDGGLETLRSETVPVGAFVVFAVVGAILSFYLPLAFVRAIGWVWRGFSSPDVEEWHDL